MRPAATTLPALRRLAGGALLLAGALLGAACGITEPDAPSLREEIQAQRDRWEARPFRDYAATLEKRCFCLPAGVEPVRIEVRRGQIVRVLDPSTGEPMDPPPGVSIPTVDGLFVLLLEAVEDGAHEIQVRWDPDLGFPADFFIDYRETVADEELGFEVHGVEPLE